MTVSLDHVGVVVGNLDHGREIYARLGFALTPRSDHSGVTKPDGTKEAWGSGNHCAMLREGYIEVIGVTDPSKPSSAREMLKRHEGIHIVALRTTDAGAEQARIQGVVPGGPKPTVVLAREAAFGPSGAETRPARFRNIYFDATLFPEARWIVIEHETPDVLWQPHQLVHPNTAVSLDEVAFVIADESLDATAYRLAATFGTTVQTDGPGGCRLPLGRGSLVLLGAGANAGRVTAPGTPPCVAGIKVGVADLDETRAVLAAAEVPFTDSGADGVVVPAEAASGTTIMFTPATSGE